MAKESVVYNCCWKKTRSGFKLWQKGSPQVKVEGTETFDTLSETLSELITKKGGAYHAVLSFNPSPPTEATDEVFAKYPLVTIDSNCCFEIDGVSMCPDSAPIFDSRFSQPSCLDCGTQSSARNRRQFELVNVSGGLDGGFIPHFGTNIPVFSETFIDLLTQKERESIRWRAIGTKGRTKRTFFEVLGPIKLPKVAIATVEETGWKCQSCDYETFGYYSPETDFHDFVAEDRVRRVKSSVFVIGAANCKSLCMSTERWEQLAGKKGTKGLIATAIGVAPKGLVSKNIELPYRHTLV